MIIILFIERLCSLSHLGAMQTPEAGADSTSTVPLQTTVPVQPTGSTQQVPVQQQVHPLCLVYVCVCVGGGAFKSECSCILYGHMCMYVFAFNKYYHSYTMPPICLARPRLFSRFSMFTQHRCSMWRKTVASTPMATCESICYPALLL